MTQMHEKMIERTRNLSNINKVNAGEWFLECWILTRWILEYALTSVHSKQISRELIDLNKLKVKIIFDGIHNEKFSEVGVTSNDIESFVSSAIETYSRIVAEQGFPECLPIITDICISGIFDIKNENVFESFLLTNRSQINEFVMELLGHIDKAKTFWNSFLPN